MMKDKIKQAVTEALKDVPLSISQTRRSGSNGLRNADEVADIVIQALLKELPTVRYYVADCDEEKGFFDREVVPPFEGENLGDVWNDATTNYRELLNIIEQGWQPIASAPKDGTFVDLWADNRRWCSCSWTGKYWFSPNGIYECGAEMELHNIYPIHWRPLPPIPTNPGAEGEGK